MKTSSVNQTYLYGMKVMEELKDSIDSLRVENHECRTFVPQNSLFQLLTREKIEDMCSNITGASQQGTQDDVVTTIMGGARRIFAILILCDHPEFIINFIKTVDQFQPSELDHRLPFDINTLQRVLPSVRADKFHKIQWEFSAPHLSNTGIPRCLEPKIILPFSEDRRLDEGGFGVVYSVKMKDDYHRLGISDGSAVLSASSVSYLIRKELLPHAKDYEVELRNLSLLKLLKHPNIIRLLSCYTYRDSHNFIFPRASDGDLGDFLSKERPEAFKRNESFFVALSGIASALHSIHYFSAATLDVYLIGCHHDLKPKNILVEGDRFLLADFGLSRFKVQSDGSRTPYRERNGYEIAPECQDLENDEMHEIGRSSDIWSFGCIIAYVLVYMRRGSTGLRAFKQARKFKYGPYTYYYFHCGHKPNEGMHEWLTDELEPSCTVSERLILQLIRKILVLSPRERPSSGYVMASLQFATLHALSQPVQTRLRMLTNSLDSGQAKTELLIEKQRFRSWQWTLGLVTDSHKPAEELRSESKLENFDTMISTLSMLQQVLDCFETSIGNPRRRLILPTRQLNASLLGNLSPMEQLKARNFLDTVLLSTDNTEYLAYLAQFGLVHGIRSLADTKHKTLMESSVDLPIRGSLEMEYNSILKGQSTEFHLIGPALSVLSDSEQSVLIEWRTYDDSYRHETILQRMQEIATLLTSTRSDPCFRNLRCRGFCKDSNPKSHALGLIYSFPTGIQGPRARIQTLSALLDQKSRSALPDLGSRYALASSLASTVLAFHQASLLHKSLSASNIAFFRLSGTLSTPLLSDPYVIGFVHSRPDKANVFTEGLDSLENRDYSHPDYLENDKRFEPWFDYYSLGLILFEIGMWRSLSKLTSEGGSPRKMVKMLMADHLSSLRLKAGCVYAECVRSCLDGSLESPSSGDGITESTEKRGVAIRVNFTLSVVSKLNRLASYEI